MNSTVQTDLVLTYLATQRAHAHLEDPGRIIPLRAPTPGYSAHAHLTFLAQLLLEARNLPLPENLFDPDAPAYQVRFARAPT